MGQGSTVWRASRGKPSEGVNDHEYDDFDDHGDHDDCDVMVIAIMNMMVMMIVIIVRASSWKPRQGPLHPWKGISKTATRLSERKMRYTQF